MYPTRSPRPVSCVAAVVRVRTATAAANTTVPTATPFKASVRVVEAAAAAVALTFDPLKSVLPFWFAPI
jgi:hypothetical protein